MTLKDLRDKIEGLADTVEIEVVMDSEHYIISTCSVVQQPKHFLKPHTTTWETRILPLVRLYI